MMENMVVDLLLRRHATRSILSKPIPDQFIAELIESVRLTPSCFNNQPWRFLFLKNEASRSKGIEVLSEGNRVWASRAPLLVIGYSRKQDDCRLPNRDYYQFDLGMSVMNIMLAATYHNLVARPMAGFNPDKVRELFGLKPEDEPLVMVAIGEPSEDEAHLPTHYRGIAKKPRERKSVSEIITQL